MRAVRPFDMAKAQPGDQMPEILTESFCERCGTRYTFESTAPRGARLKGLKVVSRGLKNFVMSDDTSIDEAMAAARSETDREVTTQQLDAFHKTFNFCLSCRQYTCADCWNEGEGRCLSCAPSVGHEILPAPFPQLDASGTLIHDGNYGNGNQAASGFAVPAAGTMSWPTSDLLRDDDLPAEDAATPGLAEADDLEPTDLLARLGGLDFVDETHAAEPSPRALEAVPDEPSLEPSLSEPSPEAIDAEPTAELAWAAPPETTEPESLAVEPDAAAPIGVEAVVAELFVAGAPDAALPEIEIAQVEPSEPIATTTDMDDVAAAASAQTTDLLRRFRPGQSLDDAIADFERGQPTVAPEPEPEPLAATPMPEPVVAAPEPVAAAQEPAPVALTPQPEPITVELESEPVAAAVAWEPDPEPVTPRVDVVPQPTWQVVAPDSPTADGVAPQPRPVAPAGPVGDQLAASGEPQWPARPEWPAGAQGSGLPFLGRPAAPTGGIEALWAESAREVVSAPAEATRATGGVQPCVSCGLSLSANARFCRRCGTRQG
ncbi:MAG: hypothetical protein ACXW4T_02740 [Candidatus Limnocylindrales bacterium]